MSLSIGTLVSWIVELLAFVEGLRDEAIRLGADPVDLENQIEDARVQRETLVAKHRADEMAEGGWDTLGAYPTSVSGDLSKEKNHG